MKGKENAERFKSMSNSNEIKFKHWSGFNS